MIQNERQYRITKAQIEEFGRKVHALPKVQAGVHPRILQAQRDALQSQLDELQADLAAYEGLRKGRSKVLELTSLDELPAALIQARIASGLTQRELAERLGMKEQQVQRYEATSYGGASLDRIREVVTALGVKVREDVFLPGADVSLNGLTKRVQSAGLSKELFMKRLVLSKTAPRGDDDRGDDASVLGAASLLNRIFGWSPAALFGDAPLAPASAALAGARLKLPVNAVARSTEIYATYARYIAGLMLRATPTLATSVVPTSAIDVRKTILRMSSELTFAAALDYVWSLGIPVLPLSDSGAFHGATWRVAGRNVIVLKQAARVESRWLNDLLHELRHAGEDPGSEDLTFIDYETLAKENASSPDETTASMFAGDVVLDGRAEALAEKCASEASGSIERLKTVVPRVANREGVPVGALANYMAFRLSLQGASWWGVATNLQKGGTDPWPVARDRALSHLDLTALDDAERSVLLRALEGDVP